MNKIVILTLCLALTACASNNTEKTTVTGQRISKEEAAKLNLTPIGSIQDFIKSQMAGMPQVGEFEGCKELLKQLEQKEISVQSLKEKEVVAVSKDNRVLTYTFKEGSCLE